MERSVLLVRDGPLLEHPFLLPPPYWIGVGEVDRDLQEGRVDPDLEAHRLGARLDVVVGAPGRREGRLREQQVAGAGGQDQRAGHGATREGQRSDGGERRRPEPRRHAQQRARAEEQHAREAPADVPRVGGEPRVPVHLARESLAEGDEGKRRQREGGRCGGKQRELPRLAGKIRVLEPVVDLARFGLHHDTAAHEHEAEHQREAEREQRAERARPAGQHAAEPQAEERRHQDQVREVGDRPDLGRDQPDEGELEDQDAGRDDGDPGGVGSDRRVGRSHGGPMLARLIWPPSAG